MILTVTLNPSLDEWMFLDTLRVGGLNRARAFARYPGGKGINVSRVVHELGGQTVAVALAGGDDGAILSRLLTAQHIAHQFVSVPGSTRNNYEIQTTTPRALTQLNMPGPRVSSGVLARLTRVVSRCAVKAQAVVYSGSLPPGAPPSTYRRLITRLAAHQVLTVLDASGPALRHGLTARPWLIKPNRAEAEELVGRRLRTRAQVMRAAVALTQRGPAHVLISLGEEGAVLASAAAQRCWVAQAPAVRVQSTVGAGDSMVAGFVLGWLRTHALEEAFRWGMACGTATALTPGTELCHRADVERLSRRVTVRAR